MSKIRKLSPHIADLIAAGEVVERPMSVVKELLENSIDAKATNITIEIQNGGISYIRITDDGIGMSREDAEIAFLRHATSKIYEQNDLDSIKTLGFRGEALAAISAVSKIDLITKQKDVENATLVKLISGNVTEVSQTASTDGTTIIVRDLFFNTPARMKFLKKDYTEASYVTSIVENLALSNPQIAFKFIKDNKIIFNTLGNNDLKSVIYNVLGKEDTLGLLEVCSYEMNGLKIYGFISKPSHCKANRSKQHFFVNKRYIKSRLISAAIEEAFKNSLMTGKFPFGVLNIEINESLVDVNVHPTKTEVKFANEKSIFESVYFGIKETISSQNIIVEAVLKPKINDVKPVVEQMTISNTSVETVKNTEIPKSNIQVEPSSFVRRQAYVFDTESKVDDSYPSLENNNDDKNIKQDSVDLLKRLIDIQTDVNTNSLQMFSTPLQYNVDTTDDQCDERPLENAVDSTQCNTKMQESLEKFDQQVADMVKPFKFIGECFRTFIMCEYDNELILIDKHAAHERINFNRLLENMHDIDKQVLLVPIMVVLSASEYGLFIENLDEINKLGFEIEDFKDKTIVVRQIPMVLDTESVEDLIFEISGKLTNNEKLSLDKIEDILHSIACKSAIKGNQVHSDFELEHLAREVILNEKVNFCPHGRPVKVSLSKYNVEKMFKRIV